MRPFFKKDFLVYWRDRKELLIAIILPVVLILVLGYAMSGWIGGSSDVLEMKVALVNEDNEEEGLTQFQESLEEYGFPDEQVQGLSGAATEIFPHSLVMQLFENDQLRDWLEVTQVNEGEALNRLEENEVVAIITIPPDFTYTTLNKMLLEEGDGAELIITAERSSIHVNVLENVVATFANQVNMQTAINQSLGDNAVLLDPEGQQIAVGGYEVVEGVERLTAFQYFTVAISIIMALFIALTVATKAITEKREHVFERIILSDSRALDYLSGKIASSFTLAFLQLTFLFIVCHFLFQLFPERSVQFWIGLGLILFIFSLTVGSLAGLCTAISLRMKKPDTGLFIFTLILGVMGAIGGSFIPIYVLPEWLQTVGEWTPNGLSVAVLIQWIQQPDSLMSLMLPTVKLSVFSVAVVATSVIIFPKKGAS